jgi:hypothetical protein
VGERAAPEVQKVSRKGDVKVRWSKRPAKILAKGAECTEIKWLDTGSTQTLPNDQLIFAKEREL